MESNFEMPDGIATVKASKEGYVPYTKNIIVSESDTDFIIELTTQ